MNHLGSFCHKGYKIWLWQYDSPLVLLYFIPGIDDDGNIMTSVDMGGVRVNGAMLSEYNCSHNASDKTDNQGTKQHFSARYDKTVLNQLYKNLKLLN